ncbi:hypothetical protein J4731_26165 [Providencia rettgeri]|nr:hypothetical protein [Providencia rettgeri]
MHQLLANSHITLPDAQDMLTHCCSIMATGKVVVENVEPTYLRNEVTWKNCLVVNNTQKIN